MNLAIVVTVKLKPGVRDAFLPLLRANAQASVRDEAGCYRFDVMADGENEILLYEIYADAAAFDVHLASPHYRAFDRDTAAMLESKAVRRLPVWEHAKR